MSDAILYLCYFFYIFTLNLQNDVILVCGLKDPERELLPVCISVWKMVFANNYIWSNLVQPFQGSSAHNTTLLKTRNLGIFAARTQKLIKNILRYKRNKNRSVKPVEFLYKKVDCFFFKNVTTSIYRTETLRHINANMLHDAKRAIMATTNL